MPTRYFWRSDRDELLRLVDLYGIHRLLHQLIAIAWFVNPNMPIMDDKSFLEHLQLLSVSGRVIGECTGLEEYEGTEMVLLFGLELSESVVSRLKL